MDTQVVSTLCQKELLPPGELKRLSTLQPLKFFASLAFDWAFIIGVLWATRRIGKLEFYPIALLLIGCRQHALGLLLHDSAHGLSFRNRSLNDFVAEYICGLPLGISTCKGYRGWHFEHHRELGTADDPELSYRNDPAYRSNNTLVRRFKRMCLDILGLGILDLLKFYFQIRPRTVASALRLIFFWLFIAVFAWRLGLLWYVGMWFASMVTWYWAVFRVRTWTEHIGADDIAYGLGHGSSHRFQSSSLFRFLFFPHNTHCHYEHHLFPTVPHYNLMCVRKMLNSRQIARDVEVIAGLPPPELRQTFVRAK